MTAPRVDCSEAITSACTVVPASVCVTVSARAGSSKPHSKAIRQRFWLRTYYNFPNISTTGHMTASSLPAGLPQDWPHREFSRTVSTGPIRWHVQVAGSGPAILLLHGTGSSAHSWADLLSDLSKLATVVVPDLPGHGFTAGAEFADLALPQIAVRLDDLLAALELPPVALVVGHSTGAALALQWALRQREDPPRAIVGFNPSLVPPPDLYTMLMAPFVNPLATSPLFTSWLASLGTREGLVNSLLDSTRSKIPVLQRKRYARLFGDPLHVRGAMGFMAATNLTDLLTQARGITIPTTLVRGTRDHWVPERHLRRVITQHFPKASVVAWRGGHVLHEEQPERAARFIIDMLSPPASG